jgi:uncharacterized iron-regulated membrane protein
LRDPHGLFAAFVRGFDVQFGATAASDLVAHEGSRSGPFWRFVVLLTGVFPVVFVVTGAIMWWRGRRGGATYRVSSRGELQAAE